MQVHREAKFNAITESEFSLVRLFSICFSLIFVTSGLDYELSVCQGED